MIKKYKYKGVEWTDLESPKEKDVKDLAQAYSLDSLVVNELLTESIRAKVDHYDNYLYLILHFPVVDGLAGEQEEKPETREIDFIIGKKFIISTHYGPFPALEELGQIFEATEWFSGRAKEVHAGHIFFFIARRLYEALYPEIDKTNNDLEAIEAGIFEGEERLMVERISTVSRILIDFKKAIRSHREILRSLEEAGSELFGKEYGFYARALLGEYEKVANTLETSQEVLRELRDTNDSLLSTKTNQVIKNLTVMAFVTLPLTLMAGIFGMNTKTEFTPIVGLDQGFWFIIILMVLAALGMFSFFKYKKWL